MSIEEIELNNIFIILDKKLARIDVKEKEKAVIKAGITKCYHEYYNSEYYKLTRKSRNEYIAELLKALDNCKKICDIEEYDDEITEYMQNASGFYEYINNILCINYKQKMKPEEVVIHELSHASQNYYITPDLFGSIILSESIKEGDAAINEKIVSNYREKNFFRIDCDDGKKIVFFKYAPNNFDLLVYMTLYALLGEKFMNKWKNDSNYSEDYLVKAKEILYSKIGDKKLIDNLFEILTLIVCLIKEELQPDFFDFYVDAYQNMCYVASICELSIIEENYKERQKEKQTSQNEYSYKMLINFKKATDSHGKKNIDLSSRILKKIYDDSSECRLFEEIFNFQQIIIKCFTNICYSYNTIEELIELKDSFNKIYEMFGRIFDKDGTDITDSITGKEELDCLIDNRIEYLREKGDCSRIPYEI